MKKQRKWGLIVVLLLITSDLLYGQDLSVLPKPFEGIPPPDMMNRYLINLADQFRQQWQSDYEKRKTPEEITAYQKRLKSLFIDALGGFPKRTPLNPRVVGVVKRDGFLVEKVLFESQPHHYVTAALFLPEPGRFSEPYPGVLVPCGHSRTGKESAAYQRVCALLALNGMAALIFDPIDQGERGQLLNEKGVPPIWGTKSHTMLGVGSILLGRNTARFEIFDGMRAIDYLQSRPEVNPDQIGCTGNSGGGTQTSYLMVVDERIKAAAPSCYITSFDRLLKTIGCQDAEQNIYGQLAFGMDHADYLMMRAPKPTLILCATEDFFDISGTWDSFRYAKRLYSRMGFAERIDLLENDDSHGYQLLQRQGAARWMARWLLNQNIPITEPPDLKVLRLEEIQCTPQGQVMLLDGARSVYDLNLEYEMELYQKRKELWSSPEREQLLDPVRALAGIRRLAELPKPQLKDMGKITREGYWIEKLILIPQKGIYLPALKFVPEKKPSRGVALYLHENGKHTDAGLGGPIEQLVKSGYMILAVDPRGSGETKQDGQDYGQPSFGSDSQDVYAAYVLGCSYVGMRAEDILVCARFAAEQISNLQEKKVRLVAIGNLAVPALHAAALEPDLFEKIHLKRMLLSWSNIIHLPMTHNQLINTVHGALKTYDLPDLAITLGNKVVIEQSVDAMGNVIRN